MNENSPLSNLTNRKHLVIAVLENIPTHRESHCSLDKIVSLIMENYEVDEKMAIGLTASTISFLELFGILENKDENLYRIKDQIPTYFIYCLKWYLKNNQDILSNWRRKGTSKDIKINNFLDMAPHFFRLMEQRRLRIGKKLNSDVGYSREQGVSVNLIKAQHKKNIYFLHKWDEAAAQYQIIGGRVRQNEDHIETAKRELHEEITEHDLKEGEDYEIYSLTEKDKPITLIDISKTYGALTRYSFWLHRVEFKMNKLLLSETDRWISLDEMRNGITKNGKSITDSKYSITFEASLNGGFNNLPDSIEISKTNNLMDYVDMKPGMFGFSVDIKKIINFLFRKDVNK